MLFLTLYRSSDLPNISRMKRLLTTQMPKAIFPGPSISWGAPKQCWRFLKHCTCQRQSQKYLPLLARTTMLHDTGPPKLLTTIQIPPQSVPFYHPPLRFFFVSGPTATQHVPNFTSSTLWQPSPTHTYLPITATIRWSERSWLAFYTLCVYMHVQVCWPMKVYVENKN